MLIDPKKGFLKHLLEKGFLKHLLEGHFLSLLVTLLVFLLTYPYLWGWRVGESIQTVLLMAILIAGVTSMRDKKRIFYIGVALGAPIFLLKMAHLFTPETKLLDLLVLILIVPFFAYVTVTTLSRVLSGEEVTLDKLFGAAAVYLLMGLAWSSAYAVLEIISPGNFLIPASSNAVGIMARGGPGSWPDFIYYSFTTLTTLGYGDINPITHRARSLAILEAVTGVLYVAFLVARLVSMYQNEKK